MNKYHISSDFKSLIKIGFTVFLKTNATNSVQLLIFALWNALKPYLTGKGFLPWTHTERSTPSPLQECLLYKMPRERACTCITCAPAHVLLVPRYLLQSVILLTFHQIDRRKAQNLRKNTCTILLSSQSSYSKTATKIHKTKVFLTPNGS